MECKKIEGNRWELTGINGRTVILEDAEAQVIMKAKDMEYYLEDVKYVLENSYHYDPDKIPEDLIRKIAEKYEDFRGEDESWHYPCMDAIGYYQEELKNYK